MWVRADMDISFLSLECVAPWTQGKQEGCHELTISGCIWDSKVSCPWSI